MEPAGEEGDCCLERLKNSLPGRADLVGAASTLERILRESVCQRQGWLRVYDVKGPATHRLSCGQSPDSETIIWETKYCILTNSQLVLLNKEKEVAVEGGQEQPAEPTKGRCLRRTVSVPSEGQFPDYPPEGATKLEGKLMSC